MSNINPGILTAEEWRTLPTDTTPALIGSCKHRIMRPYTKNIVLAPEKEFKTTFQLQVWVCASCGVTVFKELPVPQPVRVLYLHGELSPPEIQERLYQAAHGLPGPLSNFYTGREPGIHLCAAPGQQRLRELVGDIKPQVLVLDSWMNFIPGMDENSFKDISLATAFVDQLIDEFAIAASISIHEGKDHSRGARGHSLIAGWRDTLFKLKKNTHVGPKGITHTLRVSVEPRWDRPIPDFMLEFDGETKTLRPTNKPFYTHQIMQILTVLVSQGGSATKKSVGEALGLKGEALRKAIERAVKAGAVKVDNNQVIAVQLPLQGTGSPTPFAEL